MPVFCSEILHPIKLSTTHTHTPTELLLLLLPEPNYLFRSIVRMMIFKYFSKKGPLNWTPAEERNESEGGEGGE